MKIISFTDYLVFNHATSKELTKILEPLFEQFSITFFAHTRIFLDGTLAALITDAEVSAFWYDQNFAFGVFIEPGYYIANALGELFPIRHRESLREKFKLDHLFYIIEKNVGHSYIFLLATTPDNELVIQHYLSSLNKIKHFLLYYQDKAKHLLQKANTYRALKPAPPEEIIIPSYLKTENKLIFPDTKKTTFLSLLHIR